MRKPEKEERYIERRKVPAPTQRNLQCSEQEIAFCEGIISGMSRLDALQKAGYFPEIDYSDKTKHNKLRVKASNLLSKKCVAHYMQTHKRKIYISEDCNTSILKHHMYEIAMGTAKQTIVTRDKSGLVDVIEAPPSTRDQIAAASVYLKMSEADRKYKIAGVQVVPDEQAKVQENKVKSMLSKYTTVEMVSGKPKIAYTNYDEADFEELDEEENEKEE